MSISEKDIKELWGRAAGYCSAPGCSQDCVPFLAPEDPTVIGEMAHVIPRSKDSTRGDGENAGEDTYENLILLCPTCHTKVDKAPEHIYPRELLQRWKHDHEMRRSSLSAPRYDDLPKLAEAIERLLQENHFVWKQFGPESELAKQNPYSSGALIWTLRKLSTVIPNNERISQLLSAHKHLIPLNDWPLCVAFIHHALAFEQSAYHRMDSEAVPRFPADFAAFIVGLNNNKA
ncbi:MAG: HNH endonuclease signature motif containing protein [Verrucomicrobiia bacterium]